MIIFLKRTQTRIVLFALAVSQLLFTQQVLSQKNGGILRVSVSPPYAWVRVDPVVIQPSDATPQPYIFDLSPGMQRIEIWADGFLLSVDSVIVKGNDTTDYKIGLNALDPEFVAFQKSKVQFVKKRMARIAGISLGGLITGVTLAWTFQNQQADYYKTRTIQYKKTYEQAVIPQVINDAKANFLAFEKKYEEAQKKRNQHLQIGIPVACVTAGLSIWLISKYSRRPLQRPVYPDKNPFVLSPFFEITPGWSATGFRLAF